MPGACSQEPGLGSSSWASWALRAGAVTHGSTGARGRLRKLSAASQVEAGGTEAQPWLPLGVVLTSHTAYFVFQMGGCLPRGGLRNGRWRLAAHPALLSTQPGPVEMLPTQHPSPGQRSLFPTPRGPLLSLVGLGGPGVGSHLTL